MSLDNQWKKHSPEDKGKPSQEGSEGKASLGYREVLIYAGSVVAALVVVGGVVWGYKKLSAADAPLPKPLGNTKKEEPQPPTAPSAFLQELRTHRPPRIPIKGPHAPQPGKPLRLYGKEAVVQNLQEIETSSTLRIHLRVTIEGYSVLFVGTHENSEAVELSFHPLGGY